MAKRLFVGNLPYTTNEEDLRSLFSAHGQVDSVNIITDRETGRSKGFGFIDMPNDDEAQKAIAALNDSDIENRKVVVNEAKPREENGPRPSFGGGRSNYRSDNRNDRGGNRGGYGRDNRGSGGGNRW